MKTKAGIPLVRVPREIAKRTGGRAPTYCQMYNGVINGAIPAVQADNGRYEIPEDYLSTLAELYGATTTAV